MVVIEEIEVPVFSSEPVLLDDETYVREITLLMSDVFKGGDLRKASHASLRAFRQYKLLTSPTKPYPSYSAIRDPVYIYDYDKVILLDTLSEKIEMDKIVKREGGFKARTLVSELRALKQVRGALRRKVWAPLESGRGETVFVDRDPVVRHCEVDKCTALYISEGQWGSAKPEWMDQSPEKVRILAGDPAYFRGLLGFDLRKDGELELEYYKRIRPSAADTVKSRGITDPVAADDHGAGDAFKGFVYDAEYSRSIREEMSALASSVKEWKPQLFAPEGLSVSETRDGVYAFKYFQQKPSSKLDCARKLKVAEGKLESAERQVRKRTKPEGPGYVRVFDSFAKMRRELHSGVRDPELDSTPLELIEMGETVEEIMKASPTKISKEVAEDVLRGGKVIQVGERVLLVDASGRRDVFEKARDPQGGLFWALQGTVAVAGVKPCDGDRNRVLKRADADDADDASGGWDLCDIDAERTKARVEFYKDTVSFLKGCAEKLDESMRDGLVFYDSEGKYAKRRTEPVKRDRFVYNVSGVNMVMGLDDIITHPEYREGFTEMATPVREEPRDGDIPDATDTARMIVSRAVDSMSSGAMYDTIGINTRVLKNMVMFSVSGVADIYTGDEQERKARTLRLITTSLQYVVVYVTMARQIADVDRRDDNSRRKLFEVAAQRAKAVDFSEYFTDRAPLKAAMDKKLVPDSLQVLYDDELGSSPLLRDMLTKEPEYSFSLTSGGRSIKNWVGFRPYIADDAGEAGEAGEVDEAKNNNKKPTGKTTGLGAFKDLRSFVRTNMLSSTKSVAGFNKRGRCCPELVPQLTDSSRETETSVTDTLAMLLDTIKKTGYAIEKSLDIEKASYIDDAFAVDLRTAVENARRKYLRLLGILMGPNRTEVEEVKHIKVKYSDAKSEFDNFSGTPPEGDYIKWIEKSIRGIKKNELAVLFSRVLVDDLNIALSDNGIVTERMERAREERKNLQVSYVESLDAESKQAYFAQRDIGIKLDEVMEFELQNSQETKLQADKPPQEDTSHEFGDYPLETVEDDGTS